MSTVQSSPSPADGAEFAYFDNNSDMFIDDTVHTNSPACGFIPPGAAPRIIKACQLLFPLYSRYTRWHLDVKLDPSILKIFKEFGERRMVICPNHSAHEDPIVAFAISAQLHQQFYFLSAREIFMWHPTLRSLWLQSLGCYSVLRAKPDIQSYKQSLELLLENTHKIVMFPEGEVTHQNRFVTSLENGPERIALTAARLLSGSGDHSPLYLLPVAFAYRFVDDMSRPLDRILSRQEMKLGLDRNHALPTDERIRLAFNKLFDNIERQENCAGQPGTPAARIGRFVDCVIERVADVYDVVLPPTLTRRERLHYLKGLFITRRYSQLSKAVLDPDRRMYKLLKRAINFVGVSDQTFERIDTQEAAAELIFMLEYEVSGRVSLFPRHIAYVAAAPPVDVQTFVPEAVENKKKAIKRLNGLLQAGVMDALAYLDKRYPPRPLV